MAADAQLSCPRGDNKLAKQVRQMVANQQQLGALQLVGRKIQVPRFGGDREGTVTACAWTDRAPRSCLVNPRGADRAVQTVL